MGESGIQLSGGQRQRLAIARSIVKKPRILILDEATSAIDVRGEKIVQAALDSASKDRTTIVIAHRLSTIRRADRIIVLKGGANMEEGTHDELLAIENGLYRGLVNAQKLQVAAEEEASALDVPDISNEEVYNSTTFSADKFPEKAEESSKPRGFFRSAGVLIYEAKDHWLLCTSALLGILGAACKFPFLNHCTGLTIQ